MQKILSLIAMLSITALLNAQNTNNTDTTNNLPKGTYLKEGSLYVQDGYKIIQSADKKIITIIKQTAKKSNDSPEISSSLKCKCADDTNCGITFTNRKIECFGPECCFLYSTESKTLFANNPSGANSADIKWRQIPKTTPPPVTTSSDRIDISDQINKKKITNGTVVVYEANGKYKIYATYKKGKLTEWYGMGEGGKKIKSSPVALTPTTCEDCMILPGGVTVCKKCTVTPGVVLPAKILN